MFPAPRITTLNPNNLCHHPRPTCRHHGLKARVSRIPSEVVHKYMLTSFGTDNSRYRDHVTMAPGPRAARYSVHVC